MAIWQSILPPWISNLIPSATNWNNKASVHPNGHCLEHSPRHSPDIDQSEVIFEESFGASSRNHSFHNKYLITAKYMLLKIVPRYQNHTWKIWWPTMMTKTCQSCKMSNHLHGQNSKNQILPQEKCVIRDILALQTNKADLNRLIVMVSCGWTVISY